MALGNDYLCVHGPSYDTMILQSEETETRKKEILSILIQARRHDNPGLASS